MEARVKILKINYFIDFKYISFHEILIVFTTNFQPLLKQFTINIDQHVTAFFRQANLVTYCAEFFGARESEVEYGMNDKKFRDEFEKAIKERIIQT